MSLKLIILCRNEINSHFNAYMDFHAKKGMGSRLCSNDRRTMKYILRLTETPVGKV